MSDKNPVFQMLAAAMQANGVVSRQDAREAILIHDEDLPWVALPDGSLLQLLQVCVQLHWEVTRVVLSVNLQVLQELMV